MQEHNHAYVVRIQYQNAAPYHIFVDSEMAARQLVNQLEDEVNRGRHLFRYTTNEITQDYSLITTLFSLDGIRDIVTIKKDLEMSDVAWLG